MVRTDKEGYTLNEMMIVVAAIGVLAAMGSFAVLSATNKGKVKKAETEVEILATATLQLAWDTGRWPNQKARNNGGSTEIWDLLGDTSGLVGTDGSYTGWKGPYYNGDRLDPWGNPYFFDPDYRVGGVMRPVVGSFGPNGVGPNRYDSDDIYVLLDD